MSLYIANLASLLQTSVSLMWRTLLAFLTINLLSVCAVARPDLAVSVAYNHYMAQNKSCLAMGMIFKSYGFGTITFVPTFFYNENTKEITPAFKQGEITQCLSEFSMVGLNVIYRPMIEQYRDPKPPVQNYQTPRTCEERRKAIAEHIGTPLKWRAALRVRPTATHQDIIFSEYFNWLETALFQKTFHVLVANELYQSTNLEARAWNDLLWRVRNTMKAIRPDSKILVGFDPGALADHHNFGNNEGRITMTAEQCAEFNHLLWSADFFGHSTYGAISKNNDDIPNNPLAAMFADIILHHLANLEKTKNCKIQENLKVKLLQRSIVAETGFAGDLKNSWAENAENFKKPSVRKAFITWFKDVSTYSKYISTNDIWKFTTLWTTGDYDFMGISGCSPLDDWSKAPATPHYNDIPELKIIQTLLGET